MARPSSRHTGFTLIELLIVVVILSTLAAIVVPQFASSSDNAKVSAAKSSLNGIRSALEVYRTDNGTYPLEKTYSVCSGMTKATSDAEQLHQILSLYNNGSNQVCNSKTDHANGPYLRAKAFPANPIDNVSDVDISTETTLGLTASSTSKGWRYQAATGEFIINISEYEKE